MQVTIDLGSAETEKDIQALLKESLSFPDYYGYNLDALYDVLFDELTLGQFENKTILEEEMPFTAGSYEILSTIE